MKVLNKNVLREFDLLDKYETGIALIGSEVKAIRTRGIKLDNAFVKIVGNEVSLINAEIPIYEYADPEFYDSNRTRKLLLHKKEILKLQGKLSQKPNLTIVPVSCYNRGSLIKLEIALARGKKLWEQKKVEKNKTEKRRIEKELKDYRG
ncbi:SsrA-binding protein [Candidatus Roizmanbacteria bacterium RIFCSPHIGHO2_12_FULL_44_10]|uniref:SsrA-binding protein n=1 Tax=Candidatus Roizmanbacteria bacterium RIFCSPHIGHO2_12_FULL_44_10 TaxID=1802054 RepID=A0A1F7I505_9BACT|nr:MAG: SsrA-binding protein [Candidatus Roizmanbacteria bacterium RIFCSPHIGHO2_12_FULL_44_10]